MGHWALSQEEAQARSCQRQRGERGEVQCTANSSLAPTLHTDRPDSGKHRAQGGFHHSPQASSFASWH